ncbi:MAG: hypothetical protein WCT04_03165 [Planctomycetota bacterium]
MKISFYLHAWQGVLMFLMGIVCVLASFGGYLLTGGGEELFRRALLNVTSGKATYDSLRVNWRSSRIEVSNIRHEDFAWPKDKPIAELKNIQAEKLFVQLEGWPTRVESITVQGLTGVPVKQADGSTAMARPTIKVSEGFLQEGKFPNKNPPKNAPRIQFVDCELDIALGETKPIVMNGCKGELAADVEGRMRAAFSLSRLNDKPFDLTLETLEDGRWVMTGRKIQLDTGTSLGATNNPFASKIDPVGVLVKALFSGEMGARGMLTSLHIAVQPARGGEPFSCEGEVGYSNLTLKLPPAEGKSGKALPFYMGMLLGADEKQTENWWPRMMQVDQITTGALGRVAFHMINGRLDFSCDEGAGSALTGVRDGVPLPALESLKGSVETDASSLPKRIVLRGFVGNDVSFETRVALDEDRARTTELLLLPRSSDVAKLNFGAPLWRFESRVKDFVSVANRPPDAALAEFEVEATALNAPLAELLPPGLKQVSGRLRAKGSFQNVNGKPELGRILSIDEATWDDGRVVFAGAAETKSGGEYHPCWDGLRAMFGSDKAWTLHGISSKASIEVVFDGNLEWSRARAKQWSLQSAFLVRDSDLTVMAPPDLKLVWDSKRETATESKSTGLAAVGADWSATFSGNWTREKGKPSVGDFTYTEKEVPLKVHPSRAELSQSGAVKNGRVRREFDIHVRSDTVKVDAK